jgi:hypothetical protein
MRSLLLAGKQKILPVAAYGEIYGSNESQVRRMSTVCSLKKYDGR